MFHLSSSHPSAGLFCGVTAFPADNVDLKNMLVTLPPKNRIIQEQPRRTTWHTRTAAKPEASPATHAQGPSFLEKRGGAIVNGESIGGNWEPEVQWLFIGWVMLASHWLRCCQGRRKPSFLLLREWQVGEDRAQSLRTPIWVGVLLLIFTTGLKVIT